MTVATAAGAQHHRREQARYRALAKVANDASTVDSPDERVAAEVGARALRGRLAQALAALDPGDRDVLLLVAWGDLLFDPATHAYRAVQIVSPGQTQPELEDCVVSYETVDALPTTR